jgi:hypothetical protein
VTARRDGRASVHSCSAEAQRQWESRGGHASWVLSVHQCQGGELDRGESRCTCGALRGASAICLPGYARARGQRYTGPRRHAFDRVSSSSGTGCVRLCRRAPGAVSHLAQRRRQQSSGSVDTMLHGTRRQCDASMPWAHRWWHYNVEVVTGGRLDGGNFAGVATRVWSRGRLGQDGLDEQAPFISDGDVEQKAGQVRS